MANVIIEIDRMRKRINRDQSAMRKLLTETPDRVALDRFQAHHAALHTATDHWPNVWSYEDALLKDLPEDPCRQVPDGREHSIAWVLWHVTRIEDAAMNIVVAGREQVLLEGDWPVKLYIQFRHSGNDMSADDVAALSRTLSIPALRSYRNAVGLRTREIVSGLNPADLAEKTDPRRLERVMAEGALLEASVGIKVYWSRRTVAGMLLMPGSRHILTHLNEIFDLRGRVAPF